MTERERLNRKNAKAIAKMRKDQQSYADLQEQVRQGKLTAGQALLLRTRHGKKHHP